MEESGWSNFSLEHLATELQNARVRRNMSVEDVSRQLGINRAYIENIEAGNLTFMPGVYVFAYIKEYAGLLGVGSQETLERCRELLLGRKEAPLAEAASVRDWSKDNPLDRMQSSPPFFRRFLTPRALVISAAALAVLVVLFFVIRMFFHGSTAPSLSVSGAPDALIDADTAAVAERIVGSEFLPVLVSSADSLSRDSSASASKDKVRSALIAKEISRLADSGKVAAVAPSGGRQLEVRIIADETWVKVIADDSARVYAGGQFKKGDVLRYEAKQKFWVNIGRPSYVELYLDGKKLPSFSERTRIFQ
ncbi:MAG: helix-turn-helix domain-containing protein [Chlorobi bacterium]|nr:helix-turn-helix domain-containing protein [Chlorobiota bacterium]